MNHYMHPFWGELIYGSQSDLQALGLGVGATFPISADGRIKPLRCIDPRGFPCGIRRQYGSGNEDLYVASIKFPGRDRPKHIVIRTQDDSDFIAQMFALPRPAPLVDLARQAAALTRRTHIRLAWSRPAPSFSLPPCQP